MFVWDSSSGLLYPVLLNLNDFIFSHNNISFFFNTNHIIKANIAHPSNAPIIPPATAPPFDFYASI